MVSVPKVKGHLGIQVVLEGKGDIWIEAVDASVLRARSETVRRPLSRWVFLFHHQKGVGMIPGCIYLGGHVQTR